MSITVEPKPSEHLLPTGIVQQTAFWSRVKSRLGWKAKAFKINGLSPDAEDGDGTCPDDMLIVTRKVAADASVAYVPFGPEYPPEEDSRGLFLEHISEEVRDFIPRDCIFLRFDLPWNSPYAEDPSNYDDRGCLLDPPEPAARELRMNFGTDRHALRKAPTDIMPPDTILIDLRPSEEAILARMKPKTRYNIGLAGRHGVTVSEESIESLPCWYALYAETAKRDGFFCHEYPHFSTVLAEGSGQRNSTREKAEASCPGPVCQTSTHLLMARRNGEALAGMILAVSGRKATYLYGASSSGSREHMPSYALQWAAMRLAKSCGAQSYDLFGCSPRPDPEHPLYGLYRFKSGFGGELIHRQGCWDYPLDTKAYELWCAGESTAEGFHR